MRYILTKQGSHWKSQSDHKVAVFYRTK